MSPGLEREEGDESTLDPLDLEDLGSLQIVLNDEESSAIRALIRRLSPADQDLFWRRLVLEQSPAEIAGDLGIQPNAVHARLHRLRRRLAPILEREAPRLYAHLRKSEDSEPDV